MPSRRLLRPCTSFRAPLASQDLPLDIIQPIVAQLDDRIDWHTCCRVSKAFNRVATPLLYRTLDSRIASKPGMPRSILHPSTSILERPELALHVRHVTETGAVHRGPLRYQKDITENTLKALELCVRLESFSWVDDSASSDFTLLSFIDVIRMHPLRQLSIRTHSDLGNHVWTELNALTELRKISVWCMNGPARVLEGWCESLGSTLTHLELCRCAGVPQTILVSVIMQLPELRDLRLKGAPAHMIPIILSHLPHLRSLDTEYPGSYAFRAPNARPTPILSDFPTLRELTVRTSIMDDRFGSQALWGWIRGLVPKSGLEKLDLHAFTIDSEHTALVPRTFILDMARIHGTTLKHFSIGEALLTLGDIECLCIKFPNLESLSCSTISSDIESIMDSVKHGKNMQALKLHVRWIPNDEVNAQEFTLQHAQHLMRRTEDIKLREVTIDKSLYRGKWILEEPKNEVQKAEVVFQILPHVTVANWPT